MKKHSYLKSFNVSLLQLRFYFIYIYIYIFVGIFVSLTIISKLVCGELFETFVILLAILLPIKSTVSSTVFEFLFLRHF